MKNKWYLLSAVLTCLTSNIYATHVPQQSKQEISPFQRDVTHFEIISQDLATSQRDKSLDLPVVIRKDIDAFIAELGHDPEEKDKKVMRENFGNKYRELLAKAIADRLGKEKESAKRFAEDLIALYVNRSLSIASRIKKLPQAVETDIKVLNIYENALLVSLFNYKEATLWDTESRRAVPNIAKRIGAVSTDGLLVQFAGGIYRRQGDKYMLQDSIRDIQSISRDFSVILSGEGTFSEMHTHHIYVLNKETKKWELKQTIKERAGVARVSEDGSTITIITSQNTIHTYVRQGALWQEQKPLSLPKDNKPLIFKVLSFRISPRGLTMQINEETIYERRGDSWEKIDLKGQISFNATDSLMLLNNTQGAIIFVRNGSDWQQSQTFKGEAHLLPNGDIIEGIPPVFYAQKPNYHWQRQHEIEVPVDCVIQEIRSIKASQDGAILSISVYGNHRLYDTIFARYGDNWHAVYETQGNIDALAGTAFATFNGLYVIPQVVLDAAKSLKPEQWDFINDLYGAQLRGQVILNQEELKYFGALPELLSKKILSEWRVATGAEEGVQIYRERTKPKPEVAQRAWQPSGEKRRRG